ncbi:MAG: tandem-95 repeat protein [Ilumatobacter sp.]|nr:tandem-95 repeat protein [Ilumatobacter sp.]
MGSETYEVQIAGRSAVPADATGAVVNLAAVNPGGLGYFTIYPCGRRPNASALNYRPGVTVANEVVTALSSRGSVCVFTLADSDLLIDVVGFIRATDSITTLTPQRFAESRPGFTTFDRRQQAFGRAAAGSTTKVRIGGRGNVPASAAAAIVNVAVVDPDGPGFVTVHACLPALPLASSINHIAGVNRANELIAELDANGDICIYTLDDVDLIVDVVGYVADGSDLVSSTNARFLETRVGEATFDGRLQGGGRLRAGSTTSIPVAGRGDVPVDAVAVVANIAAVDPSDPGYFTFFPCDQDRPLASSINYVRGITGANEIVAPLDGAGRLCLFASAESHAIVDVVGYLEPHADIDVSVDAGVASVVAGDRIEYTVTVRNDGPHDAPQVTVTTTPSPALSALTTIGCESDPVGVPTCVLGDVAAGSSADFTVFATVERTTGTIELRADVAAAIGDPDPIDDTAVESTPVVQLPPVITSNGGGASATVVIDENTTAITNVNATDHEGDVEGSGLTFSLTTVGGGADNQHFSIGSANGAVTFRSAPDFENPLDVDGDNTYSLQVTVTDSTSLRDRQNIAVTVTDVNDEPPTAKDDTYDATEDAILVVTAPGVLSNDTDAEGDDPTVVLPATTSSTQGGSVSLASDGSFTYAPPPNFFGVDTFEYRAIDALGSATESAPATVTIDVAGVNDPPTFTGGATIVQALEDAGPVTTSSWATSIDPGPGETQELTFIVVDNTDPDLFATGPAIDPATGDLTFTSAIDRNGTAVVTLELLDDGGRANGGDDRSDRVDVTIEVGAVNDAPSFTSGPDVTADEDAGSVLEIGWASDISVGPPDEAGQSATFDVVADDPALFATPPAITGAGELAFTPAPDANGTTGVTVTLTDDGGTADGGIDTSAAQRFDITVTPLNDQPVATDDAYTMTRGATRSIPFLSIEGVIGNDIDVEDGIPAGDAQLVAPPTHHVGTFTLGADGSFSYEHDGTAAPTTDSFTYRVADADGALSNVATVTLDISPTNDAPVAIDDSAATLEDQPLSVAAPGVLANDGDAEGDPIEVVTPSVTTSAAGGTVTLAADGSYTYTPPADYFGTDSFTYQATDPTGSGAGSNTASVTVTVTGVNDAPTFELVASPDQTVDEDAGPQTVIDLLSADAGPTNEAGQLLSATVGNDESTLFAVQPAIDADTGDLTFTPADDANGSATITVSVTDNGGTANGGVDTSGEQSFTITITPVNDVPTFVTGGDVDVVTDTGPFGPSPWATSISPGAADELGQSLWFSAVADDPTLFTVAPTIDSSGRLGFTPAAGVTGATTVTVTLTDDATAGGPARTSSPEQFQIQILPRATIVVEQQTVGGDGTFSFDGSLGAFDLTTAGAVESTTFSELVPGSFSITQVAAPADVDLTNLICTSGTGASTFRLTGATAGTDAFEPGDDTSVIELAPGDTATCRFVSTDRDGSIQVVLDTVDSGGIFEFTQDITGGGPFSLVSDTTVDGSRTFDEVAPGVYEIVEPTANDFGWRLDDISCTSSRSISSFEYFGAQESPTTGFEPGDVGVRITLGGGDDSVSCRFTNLDLRGVIVVEQVTQPADPLSFSYQALGPGTGDFSLSDGQQIEFDFLVPDDTYVVRQAAEPGWTLSSISCSSAGASSFSFTGSGAGDTSAFEPGDDTAQISLADRATDVVCTFTNTD